MLNVERAGPGSRRLSRRGFLAGLSVVASATALSVACSSRRPGAPATVTPMPAQPGDSAPGATATATGPVGDGRVRVKGGALRVPVQGPSWDTFDADRSRSNDVARLLGYTHRGIVHHRVPETGELEGELATNWEQPDPLTLVFRLAPGLRWQAAPGRSARQTTPGDVRVHIERNRDGDPSQFPRSGLYAQVDRVETPDLGTVRVRFRRPDPFFLPTLAGPFARVQAPEVVQQVDALDGLDPAQVVGTGRFRLAAFSPVDGYAVRRGEADTTGESWLDEIRALAGLSGFAGAYQSFEAKSVDAVSLPRGLDPATLGPVASGAATATGVPSLMPLGGSYVPTGAPWGNPGLIGAVFRALDRRRVLAQSFPAGWELSGNVPPPQAASAFADRDLVSLPGYLEDRDRDATEARALWSAAGGPGLGAVTVDVPDVVHAQLPGLGPAIVANLAQVLGGTWDLRVETYATVQKRILERAYGAGANRLWFGFLSPLASPDPALDLYDLYNSRSRGFGGLAVPRVDDLTSRAIVEFDAGARKNLCRSSALAIHENWGAGLLYLGVERLNAVRWGYVVAGQPSAFVNSVNTWRDVSLDPSHPAFAGRPPG